MATKFGQQKRAEVRRMAVIQPGKHAKGLRVSHLVSERAGLDPEVTQRTLVSTGFSEVTSCCLGIEAAAVAQVSLLYTQSTLGDMKMFFLNLLLLIVTSPKVLD